MIKVLYVSSTDPNYFNGGAIGTEKYIETFNKLIQEKKIDLITINCTEKFEKSTNRSIKIKKTKVKSILSRILGYSDQMELSKRKILKVLNENKIDKVVIQSSRLGNIANIIKKMYPKIEIIQNFDNFEYKFSEMYTQKMLKLVRKIELFNIQKNEKRSLIAADKTIFLTIKDKEEVFNFYNINKTFEIIPIMYKDRENKKITTKNKEQLIFTGSLDMEANIEASIFLIKNIDKLFNENKKLSLVIAGRNPDIRIFKALDMIQNKERVSILSNLTKKEMDDKLSESLIYISPVFQGSGMKTKFIEAISYGLPIIASVHTMIGYDWFNINNQKFIKIFDDYSNEEMLNQINKLLEEKSFIDNRKIIQFYKENFLKDKIIEKIQKVLIG